MTLGAILNYKNIEFYNSSFEDCEVIYRWVLWECLQKENKLLNWITENRISSAAYCNQIMLNMGLLRGEQEGTLPPPRPPSADQNRIFFTIFLKIVFFRCFLRQIDVFDPLVNFALHWKKVIPQQYYFLWFLLCDNNVNVGCPRWNSDDFCNRFALGMLSSSTSEDTFWYMLRISQYFRPNKT